MSWAGQTGRARKERKNKRQERPRTRRGSRYPAAFASSGTALHFDSPIFLNSLSNPTVLPFSRLLYTHEENCFPRARRVHLHKRRNFKHVGGQVLSFAFSIQPPFFGRRDLTRTVTILIPAASYSHCICNLMYQQAFHSAREVDDSTEYICSPACVSCHQQYCVWPLV